MSRSDRARVASFDGTSIAYELRGPEDAPCLVLTNGVGCSDEYWTASLVPELTRHARVLMWNYRGHYASSPARDGWSYRVEDHARDLLAVVAAAGIERAIFFGFSLGVQVTLEAYRRRPELFQAAVLVSGAFERPLATFGGIPALEPALRVLLRFGGAHPRLTRLGLHATMGAPLALAVARVSRFCEPDVPVDPARTFLRRACREMDPTAYMRSMLLMGDHSARDVLGTLALPVLVIAGAEDSMTPLPVMDELASLVPDAEYEVVQGGRHTLLMSRGKWIARRVRTFLQRHGLDHDA